MTTTDAHAEAKGAWPDLRAELDARREACPVEHDGSGTWTLLGHAEVLATSSRGWRTTSRPRGSGARPETRHPTT